MSRLDPPTVLLDRTFLAALAHPDDPDHDRARHIYLRLVDDYEAERVLLAAVADTVDPSLRHTLLAPVGLLHVAAQHRRAAMRAGRQVPADLAVAAVLCQRHGIRRVATFDRRWADFDVTLEAGALAAVTDAAEATTGHCSPA